MKSVSGIALLGCCLLPASLLLAQEPNFLNKELNGTFPFNETIHIIQQDAVGGSCGSSLSGPVSEAIINDQGSWNFDGKGNTTINDHGIEITSNPPTDASQVVAEAANCKGTYNVVDPSTVNLHYKCSTDNWVSYFDVHSVGKITPFNILVEVALNPDGTPGVSPYVYEGVTVGCSNVLENTTVSLVY
jgi:hypothetical protein